MDPVALFLVLVAGLFLLGALGEIIFARTGIPDVVWLIAAGILLGPVTGIVPRELLDGVTPYFAALTLIVILFEGGSRLVLNDLVKAAPRATLLAIASFIISVLALALLSLPLSALGVFEGWTILHGIMLGAILGGSSSLIIMPCMALAKADEKIGSLVSLESALTDALCVVVTLAMIKLIAAGSGTAGDAGLVLVKSFGIALVIGIGAGWMWIPVLRILSGSERGYTATLAGLILLYVVVEAAGGSAAMGILAFSVVVGNAEPIMRRLGFSLGGKPLELDATVRATHSQMAFIVKSFFFTFIGMMITPPWGHIALGVFMGLVLLAARIPAVWLATRGAGFSRSALRMITISMPRGMAAGVLATLPHYAKIEGTEELPSMVFAAVLTTILVFAGAFPKVSHDLAAENGAHPDSPDGPDGPAGAAEQPDEDPSAPVPASSTTPPVRSGHTERALAVEGSTVRVEAPTLPAPDTDPLDAGSPPRAEADTVHAPAAVDRTLAPQPLPPPPIEPAGTDTPAPAEPNSTSDTEPEKKA